MRIRDDRGSVERRGNAFRRFGLGAIRLAPWLTPGRATSYCGLLAMFMAASIVIMVGLGIAQASADRQHRPRAIDFAAFWGASALTLRGRPASAYEPAVLGAVETSATVLAPGTLYPFLYPPTALLVAWPLALVPYLASIWLFLGTGYALIVSLLRRILPDRPGRLAILAFPALLVNAGNGQTGFLTASCFAGGMLFLERRPFLAGCCLGGLVAKPQLALCVPIGLAAARRWTALAGCVVTAAGGCGLSWAVFGSPAWMAFLGVALHPRAMLADEQALGRMQSVLAGLRLLGCGFGTAASGQAAAAIAAILALVLIARMRAGAGPEIAAIVLATVLATPYLFDYDLVCLGVPLAWWFGRVLVTGALPWEHAALLAAFVLPLLARSAGVHLGAPLTPPLIAWLLFVLVTRVRFDRETRL